MPGKKSKIALRMLLLLIVAAYLSACRSPSQQEAAPRSVELELLWERQLGEDTYAVSDDAVWTIQEKAILRLDTGGETVDVIDLTREPRIWTYFLEDEPSMFFSSTPAPAEANDDERTWELSAFSLDAKKLWRTTAVTAALKAWADVLVGRDAEGLVGLDTRDGAVLWSGVRPRPSVTFDGEKFSRAGDRAYFLTAGWAAQAVAWVDVTDGRAAVLGYADHGMYDLLADGEQVFTTGGNLDATMWCAWDPHTGKRNWTTRIGSDLGLSVSSVRELDAETIGVVSPGHIWALSKKDGKLKWQREAIVTDWRVLPGGRILAGTFDGSLLGLNVSDGKIEWKYELSFRPWRVYAVGAPPIAVVLNNVTKTLRGFRLPAPAAR